MTNLYKCYCGGSLFQTRKSNCTFIENGTNYCYTNVGCVSEWNLPIQQSLNNEESFFGCATKEELSLPYNIPFQCMFPNSTRYRSYCCFQEFCNLPANQTAKNASKPDGSPLNIYLIATTLSIAFVLLIVFLLTFRCYKKRRSLVLKKRDVESESPVTSLSKGSGDKQPEWSTSGSGSGLPLLVHRTIARQVQILDQIGKGRHGEVFRGKWRGEDVAVKKFTTRDERSWFREAEIYQTIMLRHENILGFIAADNKDVGVWTELWLITEYHEKGSLFDHLRDRTCTVEEMFKFVRSIASGLVHLHMEIVGTLGKPPIAHRDLKTKNILVKRNGDCAIADLGLAVRHDSATDTIDIPLNNRVGTKRYMAPEVLNDTLDIKHFDAFKRADIYSLALVYWEICRRTIYSDRKPLDFQLPYYDKAPDDPEIEDMKTIVCEELYRPQKEWGDNQVLDPMWALIQECWYSNPCARLTALRIKKNLTNLYLKSKMENFEI